MQKIPDGQYIEVAHTLWAVTAISAPLIALISFRFFPAKKRWLWLIPLFAILVQPIWIFTNWLFTSTFAISFFTQSFFKLNAIIIILFFYKQFPTLVQIVRTLLLSEALLFILLLPIPFFFS